MPERRIQYIPSHEVDREKWDECVANAPNGLIYNSSIYLDMLADQWNAVIVGDYDAVMPLPWRKKWFFKFYYHVPFIPQSGITGNYSDDLAKTVLKTVFRKIAYGDLLLNYGNAGIARQLKAEPVVNMVLDLAVEFPHLHKDYHHDLDKNLKKASRFQLTYSPEKNIKLPIVMFRKQYASRLPSIRDVDYERFTGLSLHLQKLNKAFARKITDEKNRVLAIGLFLRDQRRIYNIMNTVTPEGKRKSANHLLFDQLIREFAAQNLVLDFEGSQKPGIRKFYENFGAINEGYFWFRRMPVDW